MMRMRVDLQRVINNLDDSPTLSLLFFSPYVGLMLSQRRRRWSSIKPASVFCLCYLKFSVNRDLYGNSRPTRCIVGN